ncbi:malectin domain-containing carbohydrate-binding protein [Aquipuribacter hungaricus]|uniref:Malectin domain-containing carbohydrate-binding protein n=1 Tax=Aquipuribacter hungaricus TaxID=545624 RepID=A0ABV7WJE5_9MICO
MPLARSRARSATGGVLAALVAAVATVVPASAAPAAPAATSHLATGQPATVQAASVQAPVRINAGGPAGTFEGQAYQADRWYVGGTTSWSGDTVAGTTSSALYQARRIGAQGYAIPVLSGTYDVTVATAETWFTTSGARRFSATAEGTTVFRDLDLHSTVGHDRAHRVTARVTVTDGRLDLAFAATVDKSVVAGITVLPVGAAAPAPAPAPVAPAPAPVAGATRLEIKPPVLVDPVTVYLTSTNQTPRLDPTKDYRLVIKDGLVDIGTGSIQIGGGRNSVLIGGEIRSAASSKPLVIKRVNGAAGGHVYVEGVRLTSSTGVGKEGINVDVRTTGTRYTVQNVKIDKIDSGSSGHHADMVQVWGGGRDGLFEINRLDGYSGYQNFMLNPADYGTDDSSLRYRFSRVRAEHDGDGGIMAYAAGREYTPGKYRIEMRDVAFVHPRKTVIDGSVFQGTYHVVDMAGVRLARPGTVPSPLLGTPGRSYVSPGYVG